MTEYNQNIIHLDLSVSQYKGEYQNGLFHDENGTFIFQKPKSNAPSSSTSSTAAADDDQRKIVYQGSMVMGKINGYGKYAWYEGKDSIITAANKDINNSNNNVDESNSKSLESTRHVVSEHTNPDNNSITDHVQPANQISTFYHGYVHLSLRQGYGEHITKDGRVYKGFWQTGKRHGYGSQYFNRNPSITIPDSNNGSISPSKTSAVKQIKYQGEWVSDIRHGYGVMTYPTGNKYYGFWVNNAQNGVGLLHWNVQSNKKMTADNQVYYGTFSNNQPHGYGELMWLDTTRSHSTAAVTNIATATGITSNNPLIKISINMYRGQFTNGNRHGYGSFFYANGSQYHGFWYDNLKHGSGLFVDTNGDMKYVVFEYDQLLSQKSYSEYLLASTQEQLKENNGGTTNMMKSNSLDKLTSNLSNTSLDVTVNSSALANMTAAVELGKTSTTKLLSTTTPVSLAATAAGGRNVSSKALSVASGATGVTGVTGRPMSANSNMTGFTTKTTNGEGKKRKAGNKFDAVHDTVQIKLFVDDVLLSYYPNEKVQAYLEAVDMYKQEKMRSKRGISRPATASSERQCEWSAEEDTAAAAGGDESGNATDSAVEGVSQSAAADEAAAVVSDLIINSGGSASINNVVNDGDVDMPITRPNTADNAAGAGAGAAYVFQTYTADNEDQGEEEGDDEIAMPSDIKTQLVYQTRDLERLLQKFILVVRKYYSKCSKQASNMRIQNTRYFSVYKDNQQSDENDVDDMMSTQKSVYENDFSKSQLSDKLVNEMYLKFPKKVSEIRQVEKQFNCMTLGQITEMLRETGICDGLHFNSYDLDQCRERMTQERSRVGRELLKMAIKAEVENEVRAQQAASELELALLTDQPLLHSLQMPTEIDTGRGATTTAAAATVVAVAAVRESESSPETDTTHNSNKAAAAANDGGGDSFQLSDALIDMQRLYEYFSLVGFPSLVEDILDTRTSASAVTATAVTATAVTGASGGSGVSRIEAFTDPSQYAAIMNDERFAAMLATTHSASSIGGSSSSVSVVRPIKSRASYPLFERDCFELIIRSIAQVNLRRGAPLGYTLTVNTFGQIVLPDTVSDAATATAADTDHATATTAAAVTAQAVVEGKPTVVTTVVLSATASESTTTAVSVAADTGVHGGQGKGLNTWEKMLYNVVFQYFSSKFQPFVDDTMATTATATVTASGTKVSQVTMEFYRLFHSEEVQSILHTSDTIISHVSEYDYENNSDTKRKGNIFEYVWAYLVSTDALAVANGGGGGGTGESVQLFTLLTFLAQYGSGVYLRNQVSVQSILFVFLQTYESNINIQITVSEKSLKSKAMAEAAAALALTQPPLTTEAAAADDSKTAKDSKAAAKGKAITNDKDAKTTKDSKSKKTAEPEPAPVIEEPTKSATETVTIEPVKLPLPAADPLLGLCDTEKWLLQRAIAYDDFLLILTQILCSSLYSDSVDSSVLTVATTARAMISDAFESSTTGGTTGTTTAGTTNTVGNITAAAVVVTAVERPVGGASGGSRPASSAVTAVGVSAAATDSLTGTSRPATALETATSVTATTVVTLESESALLDRKIARFASLLEVEGISNAALTAAESGARRSIEGVIPVSLVNIISQNLITAPGAGSDSAAVASLPTVPLQALVSIPPQQTALTATGEPQPAVALVSTLMSTPNNSSVLHTHLLTARLRRWALLTADDYQFYKATK